MKYLFSIRLYAVLGIFNITEGGLLYEGICFSLEGLNPKPEIISLQGPSMHQVRCGQQVQQQLPAECCVPVVRLLPCPWFREVRVSQRLFKGAYGDVWKVVGLRG